jgi:hypothetical protein
MKMIRMFFARFERKPRVEPSSEKAVRSRIVRRLVMRFGWDEPSLARGRYLTEEDIDARREQVLAHDFLQGLRPRWSFLRYFGLRSG